MKKVFTCHNIPRLIGAVHGSQRLQKDVNEIHL